MRLYHVLKKNIKSYKPAKHVRTGCGEESCTSRNLPTVHAAKKKRVRPLRWPVRNNGTHFSLLHSHMRFKECTLYSVPPIDPFFPSTQSSTLHTDQTACIAQSANLVDSPSRRLPNLPPESWRHHRPGQLTSASMTRAQLYACCPIHVPAHAAHWGRTIYSFSHASVTGGVLIPCLTVSRALIRYNSGISAFWSIFKKIRREKAWYDLYQ